jgi:hypothetical protein
MSFNKNKYEEYITKVIIPQMETYGKTSKVFRFDHGKWANIDTDIEVSNKFINDIVSYIDELTIKDYDDAYSKCYECDGFNISIEDYGEYKLFTIKLVPSSIERVTKSIDDLIHRYSNIINMNLKDSPYVPITIRLDRYAMIILKDYYNSHYPGTITAKIENDTLIVECL